MIAESSKLVTFRLADDLFAADIFAVERVLRYQDPRSLPDGIPHVVVNGEPVILDGAHTGATPGRGLRSGAPMPPR